MPPRNLTLSMVGTGDAVGRLVGFNAGSNLAADSIAALRGDEHCRRHRCGGAGLEC